ncbi:hypothetical protein D3C81_2040230 [compost metagenome]
MSENSWKGKSFAELPEAITKTEPDPALRQSSKWLTLKGTSEINRAVEASILDFLNCIDDWGWLGEDHLFYKFSWPDC